MADRPEDLSLPVVSDIPCHEFKSYFIVCSLLSLNIFYLSTFFVHLASLCFIFILEVGNHFVLFFETQASVSRVINDALPANINVSQEARKVIAKTASVFVLYTTATAATLASKAGRKTMNANDVLEALMENEFPQFKEPLEKSLASK